jgi:hypothetical protein
VVGLVLFAGGAWLTRSSIRSFRESALSSIREAIIDMIFDLPPTPIFTLLLLIVGGALIGSFWSAAA